MKMIAEIYERESDQLLYTVDVDFPKKAATPMIKVARMVDTERRILEETFKIVWKKK